MGTKAVAPRVVCDTNVVVSALVFSQGKLARLRDAWIHGEFVPLVSEATSAELARVLQYPKFRLTSEEQETLLDDYLRYTEAVPVPQPPPSTPPCRDPDDVKFLELAIEAKADWLVTGDRDLLELTDTIARFRILTPAAALGELDI